MSYPVGTICVGQNMTINTEYNGLQCVIVKAVARTYCYHPLRGTYWADRYEVEWASGERTAISHKYLKRKFDYDEEKRAEDRTKVRNLYDALEKAAESAGQKVDQEEGVK